MKPGNIFNIVLLFALAALWAGSFLFIRVAVDALGPVLLSFSRTLIAALMLLVVVRIHGEQLRLRQNAVQYAVLGVLNAALPFVLIGFAELKLDVAIASSLNACTPLFALVLAATYGQESITARKVIALLLGAVGVFFAAGGTLTGMRDLHLPEVLASLAAAFCYASAATYSKRAITNIQPIALACGQQIAASIILLPFALFSTHSVHIDETIVLSVLLLGTASTGLAFLVYFRLIARMGATLTSTVTLIIPLFGMIFGYAFLGESVDAGKLAGLVLILLGVGYLLFVRSVENAKSPNVASVVAQHRPRSV